MKTAPISKLKATLSEYIAQVKKGEEVLVTDNRLQQAARKEGFTVLPKLEI